MIGDDHLLPKCAEILLEHGHIILGIISPLEESQQLAFKHKIKYFDSFSSAKLTLSRASYDYLFSIVNGCILPKKIINKAKKMPINFHNAPLPKYAGVHAPSWAILNNELNHGVTWHIITDCIDGGDILEQAIFPIEPEETGLSLNLKCYQYALTTFHNLIANIEKKTIKQKAQNSSLRSYYDFNKKPLGGGWLSWNNNANNIERIVRALDLGHHYHNRLASAKLKIGDDIFIVNKIKNTTEISTEIPGKIIKISESSWYISTQTTIICIEQLYTLDGKPCPLNTLVMKYNLHIGYVLSSPTQEQLIEFEKTSYDYSKFEFFWVGELLNINHSKLPFLSQDKNKQKSREVTLISKINLRQVIINSNTWKANDDPIDIILTAIFIYLYRMESNEQLGVGINVRAIDQKKPDINLFFEYLVPFSVNLSNQHTFFDALEVIKKQRSIIEERQTYSKDVFYRYPELLKSNRAEYPIAIIIASQAEIKKKIQKIRTPIIISITADTNEIGWWVPKSIITQESDLITVIENSICHIQTLLESIPNNQKCPISKLPLLTIKEIRTIQESFNKTSLSEIKNKTIIELFEKQVRATPNTISIIYQKKSLTYGELNKKANQLAHYLLKKGLSPTKYAAICTAQELHLIIGILAILKTGAAYIPIDPHYPVKHIRFLLSDSKPKILLTSKKLCGAIEEDCGKENIPIILFKETDEITSNESEKNLDLNISSENLAYIIYTSGTTGKPKGVMIPHSGVIRLVKNTNYIQIHPHDRIAQAASVSFDAATFEIWGALLNGATLIAISHTTLLNISKFSSFLKEENITILWLTSALFNQYAEKNPSIFKELTYLLVGGDVLNKERIMNVLDCKEGSPHYILNGYGPTENTTFTTTHVITHNDKNHPTIPIGKPITNTTVYILDEYLQPTPIGAIGELYCGGDGLACGYLNRPELTNEKFIKNPFTRTRGSRLYKTGDMARYFPNGTIEYLGRRDNQIKIRGFRVELSAVEAHLLHHQAISRCVVRAHELNKQTKILIAYIVCKEVIHDKDIQIFLANELPQYMIPNLFVRLNELPLTTNGKINHTKLPSVDFSKTSRMTDYLEPQTILEKRLSKLWCNLLNLKNISIDDNFFDLGGHSLLITQLILELKDSFEIDMSLHLFLDNPTIKHLSQLIENHGNGSAVTLDNFNLFTDRNLPNDIKVVELNMSKSMPKFIFLTGASGFLGAHLLHELYKKTNATIYCLVRATNNVNAISKLNSNLAKYQLNLTCNTRIIPIAGDLSLPKLGLSDEKFLALTSEIDIIYHNGAAVHHLYNYDLLRKTNVLSTIDIIRLASQTKLKTIHYISTLSAASMHLNSEESIIEDFIRANTAKNYPIDGYSQSKWVSEQLLAEATDRGIPIKIYRPGWIMGQSNTGIIAPENNHLLMLIKGCIQLGVAPNWNVMLDIFPVDILSELITSISLDNLKNKNVFNLINPNKISWVDLVYYLNSRGYMIELIDPIVWKEQYLRNIPPENALYPLYSLYINAGELDWMKGLSAISRANCSNTDQSLSKYKLMAPIIDKKILNIYFDFLEKNFFIKNTTNQTTA